MGVLFYFEVRCNFLPFDCNVSLGSKFKSFLLASVCFFLY